MHHVDSPRIANSWVFLRLSLGQTFLHSAVME
jgi:hypothetical protein